VAEIINWLGIFVTFFLMFVVQELCEIAVMVVFNVMCLLFYF